MNRCEKAEMARLIDRQASDTIVDYVDYVDYAESQKALW